jgi:DNA-binding response OmpR family regulator
MKKKIIVVEDDADILFTVNIILTNADYEVTALTSGQCILDGNYSYPDLFILDKRMPDMDGLDVCRHIRSISESKEIPVIIISASPKFGQQAVQAGANGFLAKPFKINDLLNVVALHLSKKS